MFDPSDFTDESFSDELETDVASECGKCGQIEKITVFSKHPNGVVIVKFSTSYASQECVKLMDGRFFGGKKLRCYFWDGATDFTGESSVTVCLSVCLSVPVSVHVCLSVCASICSCLPVCASICSCLSVPISVHVCLSVCASICSMFTACSHSYLRLKRSFSITHSSSLEMIRYFVLFRCVGSVSPCLMMLVASAFFFSSVTSFPLILIAQSFTVLTMKKKRKNRKRHDWMNSETGWIRIKKTFQKNFV